MNRPRVEITLRDFFSIINPKYFIQEYCCYVNVVKYNNNYQYYETEESKRIDKLEDLEEFLDNYIILEFKQDWVFGEIDRQDIILQRR